LGVYIGHSLVHAGNVPVIYNPVTTHISPQYHVVFDDQFTTVGKSAASIPDEFFSKLFSSALWEYQSEIAPTTDDLYTFDTYWLFPVTSSSKRPRSTIQSSPNILDGRASATVVSSTAPTISAHAALSQSPQLPAILHSDTRANSPSIMNMDNMHTQDACNKNVNMLSPDVLNMNVSEPLNDVANMNVSETPTLSQRPKKLNLVKAYLSTLAMRQWQDEHGIDASVYRVTDPTVSSPSDNASTSVFSELSEPHAEFLDLLLLSYVHLVQTEVAPEPLHVMSSNKEDILTQCQMLKTEDKAKFIESQKAEIEGLLKFDVMDIHPISKLPPKARLLHAIWSYRRKRLPSGVLLKYKSRICVNGKEQVFGRDYWETYAPVASWAMICMLLLLSSVLNFKSHQVDYTQAFPQASLDDAVFMRIPQGWFVKDGVLHQHENPKFNDTHY
jgi:hypothetical protein